jgi:manganese/iron transport system ATP-binding protein/manganese/zinc/iron transport system ATP- binding protein
MSNHRLSILDVTVSYDHVPAIQNLNLELRCGCCMGLLGPNGAGKSTLLKAIAGLVAIQSGSIRYHGHARSHIAQSVVYLPQRGVIDWDFPITVRGMVAMGRFSSLGGWRSFGKADAAIVNESLEVTQLHALAGRQINALSGGQQQRAFLARAYAQQAHVCLLDEPFSGLDTNSQNDLRDILRAMVAQGKLLLVSHHDLKTVPDLFDEVVMLNRELIACGQVSSTFTSENIAQTYSRAGQTSLTR